MKASQVAAAMRIKIKDHTLTTCTRLAYPKTGVIVSPDTKREGNASKALVLFDGETQPRYVALARLEVNE